MQSYTIILDQQKLCHCHFAILIAFPLSFAVETPSVTFAIENSLITNHSSLICAKGALKNMSVALNTQLEELLFSSQIIYTWRRLRHQNKLYGVRLAQVFPARYPWRLHPHLRHRTARHQLTARGKNSNTGLNSLPDALLCNLKKKTIKVNNPLKACRTGVFSVFSHPKNGR